jgi:hypothetical protein
MCGSSTTRRDTSGCPPPGTAIVEDQESQAHGASRFFHLARCAVRTSGLQESRHVVVDRDKAGDGVCHHVVVDRFVTGFLG